MTQWFWDLLVSGLSSCCEKNADGSMRSLKVWVSRLKFYCCTVEDRVFSSLSVAGSERCA